MAFVICEDVKIRPEALNAFKELVGWQAERSVARELECLQFDVCQLEEDSSNFRFYEVYSDAEAFEIHRELPRLKEFMAKLQPMLAEGPIITRMQRLCKNAK